MLRSTNPRTATTQSFGSEGDESKKLNEAADRALASVNAMANELVFDLEGARRSFALGIQQMVELSELLANRALDIAAPR
ncbi:DUF6124 family protein [Pseudomonas sp. KB_12]|uniref:DUF6124 family protein n=1 Tax=Pseudomonas sp. KB_12 TaxID=3233034 RepID=UPI003F972598